MNPLLPDIAQRARYRCEYCHAPQQVFNFPFEVEHIIPVVSGGDDSPENLALSCRSCNIHKAARLDGVDPKENKSVPLFHPRRDRWAAHFQVDPESGVIDGRTSIGRATVASLDINSPTQLLARSQWIRLGLFP